MSTVGVGQATLFDEYVGTVRGEFRYFALYRTDFGCVEARFIRSDKEAKDNDSGADASFTSRIYRPDWEGSYSWKWLAALGYAEIESRDVPKHSDNPESFLELLREDAERLVARSLSILDCTPGVGA